VVKSQSQAGVSYLVSDVLTPWATCSCPAGDRGELCKHRAKVLQVRMDQLVSRFYLPGVNQLENGITTSH